MRIGDDGAHLEVDAWLAASSSSALMVCMTLHLKRTRSPMLTGSIKVDVAHLHEHWMTAGKSWQLAYASS